LVFFKQLQNLQNFIFGDPLSSTFEVRKSFFEIIFASIGFLVIKNIADNYLDFD